MVEDAKTGKIMVKQILETLNIVGKTSPPNSVIKANDILVKIGDDDSKRWPLVRVIARLNNFRVPVGGTVRLTFVRKVRLDGEEGREDKPDFSEDDNPWDADPAGDLGTPIFSANGDKNHEDGELERICYEPFNSTLDPYPNEVDEDSSADNVRFSRARSVSKNVFNNDTVAMATKIQNLMVKNEDLEIELHDYKEKLTAAQASLESTKRQLEDALLSVRESSERAQSSQVELQKVLLSTEEYHRARRMANANKQPEDRVFSSQPAKTLKECREKAIAAVAATDPTGGILLKWEREGKSAEEKLKGLEARLAKKGLLNVSASDDEHHKSSFGQRSATLSKKLNPSARMSRTDLIQKNVTSKGNDGVSMQMKKRMKDRLNQKIKFRPHHNDLIRGGILRPGARGNVHGSRFV